jgi:hypothetical protein
MGRLSPISKDTKGGPLVYIKPERNSFLTNGGQGKKCSEHMHTHSIIPDMLFI